MAFYSQNLFPDNLYPSPSNALKNADNWMQTSQNQMNSASCFNYNNFNGYNNYNSFSNPGFYLPMTNYGYGNPFMKTSISYSQNADGAINYNYSNKASGLAYMNAIGNTAANVFGTIGMIQASKAQQETQRQALSMQYDAYQQQSNFMRQQQQQQFDDQSYNQSFNNTMQMALLYSMGKQQGLFSAEES